MQFKIIYKGKPLSILRAARAIDALARCFSDLSKSELKRLIQQKGIRIIYPDNKSEYIESPMESIPYRWFPVIFAIGKRRFAKLNWGDKR